MKKTNIIFYLFLFTLLFGACKTTNKTASMKKVMGAVYIATNNTPENSLVGFMQYSDGSLKKMGEYKTGGKGTGDVELFDVPFDPTGLNTFADGIDPLASAYGVWRTPDHKNVLVVNAGNGTLSSLRVMKNMSLKLTNVVQAGNVKPETIAAFGNLVFVASLGDISTPANDGTLMGFKISKEGILTPMMQTKRKLSGRPVSLQFTPDGKYLTLVEITTGVINVFKVFPDGNISEKPVSQIASPEPEGRYFSLPIGSYITKTKDNGYHIFVTETRFVTQKGEFHNASEAEKKKYPFLPVYSGQTGSVSSYKISSEGKITLISGDIKTGEHNWGGQQATCWVVVAPDGKRLWTDAPLTSSINAYDIAEDGSLTLSDEIVYQAPDYHEYFLDMDLSGDGKFINVVSGNTGKVFVFKYNNKNNKLIKVGEYEGGQKTHTYGLVSIKAL